jgi:nitrite reductase/ring-hydroxylating ferredoxin subunit
MCAFEEPCSAPDQRGIDDEAVLVDQAQRRERRALFDGKYFAVTRRCRHLRADLAGGSIEDGRLVCPWHQSAYDVENGQMVRGPQQISAKIPGLGATFKMLTKVWPLGRGTVSVSGNDIVVE